MDEQLVRIYGWANSGVYGGYSEARDDRPTQAGGGFGDANVVFDVPAELWARYCAADEAKNAAEDAIGDLERAQRAQSRVESL